MLIQWNDRTMGWFEDASAYTGFHEKLIGLFWPYVTAAGSLVDLGCGAGLVDYLLAQRVKEVTCVDQNAQVLAFVEKTAKRRGITNLRTLEADAKTLSGQWDTVLMSFFGRLDDAIGHYLSLAKETVIAVVHADMPESADADKYHPPRCNTVSKTVQGLDQQGVRYTLLEDGIEYGQPFVSREDAEAFTTLYKKNPPGMTVDEYLDSQLTQTGRDDFPYYLPNLKRFGIFIIRREDNAHI